MTENTQSSFLDSLYKMANEHDTLATEIEDDGMNIEPINPKEMHLRRYAALNGITKRMVGNSIPCDDDSRDELENEVIASVDRYFATRGDKLIQYFADTDNYATRVIKEALEKDDLDDIDKFVDEVLENEENGFDGITDKIKSDIDKSAQDDLANITDDIRNKESDGNDGQPQPERQEDPLNESVFHHYLMKHYSEAEVPNDIDQMLVRPMVETALHYVRRVLFNDGFGRGE